ncbi:MAG: guanylate kinase [Caldisericaceae bacterium]
MIIIVSGPSGVGKGTVVKEIGKRLSDLKIGITCTTRKPRVGEKNGVDYYFVSEEEFEKLVSENRLAEHSLVHGNHYGTPMDEIEQGLHDMDIVFQIDVQGAKKIKNLYNDALLIFLMPPSLDSLLLRLNGRGTETAEERDRRIKRAQEEMEERIYYDYIVTNDNLEKAVNEIIDIIKSERLNRGA